MIIVTCYAAMQVHLWGMFDSYFATAATSSSTPETVTIGEGDSSPPSFPSLTVKHTRHRSGSDACSRKQQTHDCRGWTMDTDEDSLAKAMRRKAVHNLDNKGISSSCKLFLTFSTPTI